MSAHNNGNQTIVNGTMKGNMQTQTGAGMLISGACMFDSSRWGYINVSESQWFCSLIPTLLNPIRLILGRIIAILNFSNRRLEVLSRFTTNHGKGIMGIRATNQTNRICNSQS